MDLSQALSAVSQEILAVGGKKIQTIEDDDYIFFTCKKSSTVNFTPSMSPVSGS